MIICKINNVNNIDIIGKEINGDSTIRFGDSQDFVILQSDTINLNVGDTIELTGLEDERNFFLKPKEEWMMNKLQKADEKISQLQENHKNLEEHLGVTDSTVTSIMTEVIPSIMI